MRDTKHSQTSRFENKAILITGGSSGIGLAAAKRLAAEGAQVLVTGVHPERVAKAENIEGVRGICNDAGALDSENDLRQAVLESIGKLDGIFLNAGYGHFVPHEEVTATDFEQQFAVNLRAPILQLGALSDLISEGGSVVLNTSVAQNLGMAGASLYASSKGALRSLSRVLARELAPRNIRVNAVSPGPITTNFFSRMGMQEEEVQGTYASMLEQAPLGRLGTPEEVAAVALFLLSEDSSFVTGSEYVVDGGYTEL